MLGAVVHRTEFERLLAVPPLSRSAHFALHHVAALPDARNASRGEAGSGELSTVTSDNLVELVNNSSDSIRFGVLVPKRHARRAVTRNLVKRLGREAMRAHAHELPRGLWLLRLRAGFALSQFASARSAALAIAMRQELDRLLRGARARSAAVTSATSSGAPT